MNASGLETKEVLTVGIGNVKVGRSPQLLVTHSLGSCVGIVLYDSLSKIGGLAHILLPDSKKSLDPSKFEKFADTAIAFLLKKMEEAGVQKKNVTGKLVGGASMFMAAVQDDSMKIGTKNVEAARMCLKSLGIRIVAEDTEGNWGRTVEVSLETGKVTVKSAVKGMKQI